MSSYDIVGVVFVEKNFAVSYEEYIGDASFFDGVPARLAAPPMAPEVKIGAFCAVASLVVGIIYRSALAMVIGMTTLAKLVALTGLAIQPHPFAAVLFMMVAAVGTLA